MTKGLDDQAARDRDSLGDAIGRVAQGDRAALSEVYSRTSAKLFGICLRILQDRGEAEDAMQDIFVSVWRRAATFDRARAGPMTWLIFIARSRAIDRLRSSGRARSTAPIEQAQDIADERPDALRTLEAGEERSRLMTCVEELEARQADAIRRAFFDGATYNELAIQSAVPLGTMKSWVRRGLIRLKECLER